MVEVKANSPADPGIDFEVSCNLKRAGGETAGAIKGADCVSF